METQQYIELTTPFNILALLDRHVLENLPNGYSFALGSGITVLYPSEANVTQDTLDRIDALGIDALPTSHQICAEWRDAVHELADR